jgi:hypothetical protein
MELEQTVERHERALYGEERDGVGLLERMKAMEDWREKLDKERTIVMALLAGILAGLGLNGVGVLAILRAIGGL